MEEVKYYDKPLKLKGAITKKDVELERIPLLEEFILGKANTITQKRFVSFVFHRNKARKKQGKETYSIRTWSEDGYLKCKRKK